MPVRRPSRRLAAIPLLAVAAAAAGCSTSSTSSAPAPTTAPVTTMPVPVTTVATVPATPTSATTPTTPTTATTSTTAAAAADPCTLITKEQIQAATGTAPAIAEPEGTDRCNFGIVRTWVDFGESWITSVAARGETVSGVGDAAAYDPRFHQIYVKAGGRTFNIQCTLCQGDQKAVVTRLAQDAVANLG